MAAETDEAAALQDADGIAGRVKTLRLLRKKTIAWVAEQTGVSSSAVGFWESGQTTPSLISGLRLARAFGVSPWWIAFGEGQISAMPSGGLDREAESPLPADHPLLQEIRAEFREELAKANLATSSAIEALSLEIKALKPGRARRRSQS